MTKLTFNIDLRDYNTTQFEKNPIVLHEFDYTIPPVGKAKIASDKMSVEVELATGVNPVADMLSGYTLGIKPSTLGNDLSCLSVSVRDINLRDKVS